MKKRNLFGIVVTAVALATPLRAHAEDLTEEQIKKIVEQAKPYIEAEVQRRVNEELDKRAAAQTSARLLSRKRSRERRPHRPRSRANTCGTLVSIEADHGRACGVGVHEHQLRHVDGSRRVHRQGPDEATQPRRSRPKPERVLVAQR